MRFNLNTIYEYEPTLFDNITLPDTLSNDIMISRILLKCGDLYPYIQVPEYLKAEFGRWFEGMHQNIHMMFRALNEEYNPVENTTWVDEINRATTSKGQNISNTSSNGSSNNNNTEQTSVNAYNSGTPTDREKVTSNTTASDTNKANTLSNFDNKDTENVKQSRHGNIGVMTTAQIITSELEMRKIDLYDEVVKLFEKTFIMQIY